jgi:cell filamentation protein
LPPSLRHAVDQTIAAERLEGWNPTDADIESLAALVCERSSFGEYLASYRTRYPPESAPPQGSWRLLRRSRPYLIPGTAVLRNNFGVDTAEALSDLEFVATAGRTVAWHRRLTDEAVRAADVDVRLIHQHVFGDVYTWAGRYRVTELRRGDSVFALQSSIARSMAMLEESARALAATGAGLDSSGLAYRLAGLYAEYNRVHPFREGNGRAGTLLLHTVAALCGRRLDLTTVSRDEWYAASRDSMPFRRDGAAGHRPFLPLLTRAVEYL